MSVYKIKNVKTGLFSNGGAMPSWTKDGKVWRNRQSLSGHLSVVWNKEIYDNAIVIEYETIETLVTPVTEIIKEKELKKSEREKKYAEQRQKYIEDKERQLLQELKQKYEK